MAVRGELAVNAIAAIKVLVADDSSTIRKHFKEFAERWPTQVDFVEAADGPSCLEQLQASRFDMAFLDVHMPGMTGIEALCHARHSGNDTFVVIMSSQPKGEIVEVARKLQAYDFIRKPFPADDLAAIFRTYERIVQPVRALIVDDSATVRRVITKIIDQSIFRVTMDEASTGLQAVDLCERGRYDVVFLDVNMPSIDGPQTLARLRSQNENVRVVVNSSEPEDQVRRRFGNQRIEIFLKKPFYPKDVDRAMRTVFDLPAPYQIETAA
jgi:CheY-like chemotaxis protein